MWSRAKHYLLPICGALSAILAFKLSAPYESTLLHQELKAGDPAALYTYGTKWGEVNRIAFGIAICASFSFLLNAERKSWWRVLAATLVGGALGGAFNYVMDSSADLVGIGVGRVNPMIGQLVATAAWAIFVPFGIALTVAAAQGITRQRLVRVGVSTFVAGSAAVFAQTIVGVFKPVDTSGLSLESVLTPSGGVNLLSQLPVWRTEAIATGVALGLSMALVDQYSRAGSLRLLLGRNEYRDWSLDHKVSRIGRSEGLEIPLWGFASVAPEHARIVRGRNAFTFEASAPGCLVNGVPTQSCLLQPGDMIQIGDASLIFSGRGAPRLAGPFIPPGRSPISSPAPLASAFPAGTPHFLVDAQGGQYTLSPGTYSVGREAGNSICLSQDSTVSRQHATLQISDQGSFVTDLGSSNGTKVNGNPVQAPTPVHSGDVLEFGSATFNFR